MAQKPWLTLSVALSLFGLTSGCVRAGVRGDMGHNPFNNPPVNVQAVPQAWAGGREPNQSRWSGNALGDRVAQLALSVPYVASSVAVPSGRVVLVGVDLSRSGNPNINAVKTEIRRRLLIQAPIFRYVYVTTDPRQVAQLNHIADGLRQGHPISHYHLQMEALKRAMQPVPWPG